MASAIENNISIDDAIILKEDITFSNLLKKVTGYNDNALPNSIKNVTDREMFSAYLQVGGDNQNWVVGKSLKREEKIPSLDLALVEEKAQKQEEFIDDLVDVAVGTTILGPAMGGAVVGGAAGALVGAAYGVGVLVLASAGSVAASYMSDIHLGTSTKGGEFFTNYFDISVKEKNLIASNFEAELLESHLAEIDDSENSSSNNYFVWNDDLPKQNISETGYQAFLKIK